MIKSIQIQNLIIAIVLYEAYNFLYESLGNIFRYYFSNLSGLFLIIILSVICAISFIIIYLIWRKVFNIDSLQKSYSKGFLAVAILLMCLLMSWKIKEVLGSSLNELPIEAANYYISTYGYQSLASKIINGIIITIGLFYSKISTLKQ